MSAPRLSLAIVFPLLFGLGACDPTANDAGTSEDAGPADDAGGPDADGGEPSNDAGTDDDGGQDPTDAGQDPTDAGADAGPNDAGAVDLTPPTVTISDDVPLPTAGGDITFTFTFSEDVGTSFAIDDVTVVGGTPGALDVVSGTSATLVVSPPANVTGVVQVTVAAMSFADAAGNTNVGEVMWEQPFDTNPPPPFDGAVFDDTYGTSVTFTSFSGAVNDLTVDPSTAQVGTASLRVAVPAAGYTGGALALPVGANLSSYNALTFWARADAAVVLDVVGIGNDGSDGILNTETRDLALTTTWAQFTIPLPDPSVLTSSRGLFHFAEGAGGAATAMWLDDVRYTSIASSVVTNPRPVLAPATQALAIGDVVSLGGTSVTYAVNGVDLTLDPSAPAFFTYTSSSEAVATVDGVGTVTAIGEGSTTITADLLGSPAAGAVTISIAPACPAPTGPNLAVNGDFEAGDFRCVEQSPGAGTQTITTDNPSGGQYAVNLNVQAVNSDSLIKFANLAPGAFTPGETLYISFDLRGQLGTGGVVFAEFFSELTGGGTSAAEILFGNGPIFPDADSAVWTSFSTTAVTGSDTSGGVTLQLKTATGAGTLADVFFDNVCVSLAPCP